MNQTIQTVILVAAAYAHKFLVMRSVLLTDSDHKIILTVFGLDCFKILSMNIILTLKLSILSVNM